jgi:transposase
MAGKKGMKHYPLATKLEAIRLYQEEGKTQKEITTLLGIQDPNRVRKWLAMYRRHGEAAFQRGTSQPRRGRPPKRENTEAYIARLEMENDLLKKFHAELRKLERAKRNIG